MVLPVVTDRMKMDLRGYYNLLMGDHHRCSDPYHI